MQENEQRIAELRKRLDDLARYHEHFAREIVEIRRTIDSLASASAGEASPVAPPEGAVPPPITAQPPQIRRPEPVEPPRAAYANDRPEPSPKNLERFVGEHLIAMVGVVITVIGVAIGAKYAIDNGWITPVMRIVFGYLIGIGLLVPAFRLREKYPAFSALTLSGAMAVFYFITYAAYSFYGLMPQTAAFVLMVAFTVFTVIAAIRFDRVIIAHIGLVGAYAVPFLLSENEGRAAILFSYMAIINAGILAVSVARYWRSIFYSSFVITWLLFFAWYNGAYSVQNDFQLALAFATVFFAIFYATFIAWKLVAREPFGPENVALVLANSFIYFGLGYAIIDGNEAWKSYLGMFTVGNAFVHFLVAAAIHRFASTPPSVVNLIVALVIAFITIAVPVQLEGRWITLLWTAEATALFAVGRAKRIALYEWFSYPLMALGAMSLLTDWLRVAFDSFSHTGESTRPFVSGIFVVNVVFIAATVAILWFDKRFRDDAALPESLAPVFRFFAGAALAVVVFNCLRIEISNFWTHREFSTAIVTGPESYDRVTDRAFGYWNAISQIDYAMLFVAAALFLNRRFLRSQALALAGILFAGLFLFIFISAGFAVMSELRDLYLRPVTGDFITGPMAIGVRYISYAVAGVLVAALGISARDESMPVQPTGPVRVIGADAVLHVVALACLSSELLSLTDVFGVRDSEKLLLSILWGIYALCLIAFGIWRSKKHLRIGALVLFAGTLLKLFFYDLADLGTISKTVVFVALGVLLLIAGYFYNKFDERIFKSDAN